MKQLITKGVLKSCLHCRFADVPEGIYPCKKCYEWDYFVPSDDYVPADNGMTGGDFDGNYINVFGVDVGKRPDFTGYPIRRSVLPEIKNVIFHDPATIVLWSDGTKTVVKCGEHDAFDKEKGLAMAIAKKALGNKGNYFNEIKKWTEEGPEPELIDGSATVAEILAIFDRVSERLSHYNWDPAKAGDVIKEISRKLETKDNHVD